MNRASIKVVGESGMGLLSIGMIVASSLKELGFYVNSHREYPSLIKGGHSSVQVDFSSKQIRSLRQEVDLMVALDSAGLKAYIETVKKGGIIVHGLDRVHLIKGVKDRVAKRKIKMVYFPALKIVHESGGRELMVNTVLLGFIWKVFKLNLKPIEKEIRKKFAKKPDVLKINLKCVNAGYKAKEAETLRAFKIDHPKKKPKTILLDGNQALALGAIQCGVRAYYAYPMSPSSSILMHVANYAKESGMLVKQAEDEITASQLALGSMHMGTRALVGTSGGGFDLMTETFSLAGMIETPLVVIDCQRPGPATGMPTWTGQGDLLLAIHAGHGEYGRLVVAGSDPASCYELIQHTMNYAEEFQVPTVFLSEKVICETQAMVEPFKQGKIPIKRGLVTKPKELEALVPTDRYKITKSGVSLRWAPGTAKAGYYANGDEHREDGRLTEDADRCAAMIDKRMRKMAALEKALPEPIYFGAKDADIVIVGWGSTKNTVLDVIDIMKAKGKKVGYLHYEYLWPLKTAKISKLLKDHKNVHLLEGNYGGQLASLIENKVHLKFKSRFLKYNGRPFFVEEVIDYIFENLKTVKTVKT